MLTCFILLFQSRLAFALNLCLYRFICVDVMYRQMWSFRLSETSKNDRSVCAYTGECVFLHDVCDQWSLCWVFRYPAHLSLNKHRGTSTGLQGQCLFSLLPSHCLSITQMCTHLNTHSLASWDIHCRLETLDSSNPWPWHILSHSSSDLCLWAFIHKHMWYYFVMVHKDRVKFECCHIKADSNSGSFIANLCGRNSPQQHMFGPAHITGNFSLISLD